MPAHRCLLPVHMLPAPLRCSNQVHHASQTACQEHREGRASSWPDEPSTCTTLAVALRSACMAACSDLNASFSLCCNTLPLCTAASASFTAFIAAFCLNVGSLLLGLLSVEHNAALVQGSRSSAIRAAKMKLCSALNGMPLTIEVFLSFKLHDSHGGTGGQAGG